jgi:hypothetical protein
MIVAAERVRHLAWMSSQEEPWSPDLNAASLRRIAHASTVSSHNCHILLRALAQRTAETGDAQIGIGLSAASDAAGRVRDRWLQAARAISQITTEVRGRTSVLAAEASDLALWTGRLAYTDPQWTPSSGPTHPARPPESLAAKPEDLPRVVTAVHQACETLAMLGETQRERIRAAAQAGRILVPTSSLPDDYDIPRPFAQAPQDRVGVVLAKYTEAVQVARETVAVVGEIATATQAPSRVLTTARNAADAGPSRTARARDVPGRQTGQEGQHDLENAPGPTERALHELGINEPDLLTRGAEIDRTSERLIIDAATGLGPSGKRPNATALSRSRATAALVNHALASGDPRATALLRRPEPHQREQSEPEAEVD